MRSAHLDPFLAGRTSTQAGAAAEEAARRIVNGEADYHQPPRRHEPDVDGDTRFIGSKLSRWAKKQQRGPRALSIRGDGVGSDGHWYGTPGADFDVAEEVR